MANTSRRAAFTLLELLAVVSLMGIIAAIVVPRIRNLSGEAKSVTCATLRAEMDVESQLWFHEFGRWPARDFSDMARNANYLPDGLPVCPVDGTAYRFDPTRRRVVPHSHE